MFTDIVGYTAIMDHDEKRALEILDKNREIHHRTIEQYNGTWLKEIGDGVLLSFESPSDSLRCAYQLMRDAKSVGYDLRIGVHLGEVVYQNGDVFGSGVNIASRLQALALPGSVLFTDRMHDDILNKPELKAKDIGLQRLKNVDRPVKLYALAMPGLVVPSQGDFEPVPTQAGSDKPPSVKIGVVVLAIIILAVIAVFAGKWMLGNIQSDTANASRGDQELVTLAAIPFSNISGQAESDFLGYALADQVINSLSYLKQVIVRPSSAIRKYTDVEADPATIRSELDVEYVLTGNYLNIRDSLRINLELVNTENNQVIWTETVTGSAGNTFQLQDIVAQKVIEGLSIEFSSQERKRMVQDVPGNPLAYDYYLRALTYPSTVKDNLIAIEMLKQSIALDSTFAPAYAELAGRQLDYASYALPEANREDVLKETKNTYLKALDLNPGLLKALIELSQLSNELNEKDEAIKLARRVIKINPNNPGGHLALAYVYRYTGMIDDAIREIGRAEHTLNPKTRDYAAKGINNILLGNYVEAARNFEKIESTSFGFRDSWLGYIYYHMDQVALAREKLAAAIRLDPEATLAIWAGAMLSTIEGDSEDWTNELRKMGESLYDPEAMFWLCTVMIKSGDLEGGLTLFERAVNRGYYPYPGFLIEPWLDPVRDSARFRQIMTIARGKHEAFKKKHF